MVSTGIPSIDYVFSQSSPWVMGELTLDNRIGNGHYRETYRDGFLLYKVGKSHIRKRIGPFNLYFPSSLYTLIVFGTTDINSMEYKNYLDIIGKVPEPLRDSFAQIFGVFQSNGKMISINETVANHDGRVSPSLKVHGYVSNPYFWSRMAELEELFTSKDLTFFNINGGNIVVKELEDGSKIPVFIDYKRTGVRNYPLQLNLLLESERVKRTKNKFSRIREKYQIKTP